MIQERSFYTSHNIFTKLTHEQGLLSDLHYNLLDYWFKNDGPAVRPDLFIYLKTPVELCMERMVSRNRHAEHEVPADYLRAVSHMHEKMFVTQAHELECQVSVIETGTSITIPEIGSDIVRIIARAQLDQNTHNGY